jgi:TPR repeat protein
MLPLILKIRCKAVQSHSLGVVLRNAAQTIIVATSNHKLPKAAARRLALPSKRKPSRVVFGNAKAPSEAAAEYRLAAAQGHATAQFNWGWMIEDGGTAFGTEALSYLTNL